MSFYLQISINCFRLFCPNEAFSKWNLNDTHSFDMFDRHPNFRVSWSWQFQCGLPYVVGRGIKKKKAKHCFILLQVT